MVCMSERISLAQCKILFDHSKTPTTALVPTKKKARRRKSGSFENILIMKDKQDKKTESSAAAAAAAAKDPVIIDSNEDEDDDEEAGLEAAARRFTEAVSTDATTTTTSAAISAAAAAASSSTIFTTTAANIMSTRRRTRSGSMNNSNSAPPASDLLGNLSNNNNKNSNGSNNNNKTSTSSAGNKNASSSSSFSNKSNTSNNKKAAQPQPPPPLPAGLETLLRLMDEADYEMECDPYRGMDIVALESARQRAAAAAAAGAAAAGNNNINNNININSPWRFSCSFGSSLLLNQKDAAHKEGFTNKFRSQYCDSSGNNCNNNGKAISATAAAAAQTLEIAQIQAQQLVEMACQNSCPTLIQWTRERIIKDNKDKTKKKAAAKKKKNARNNNNNNKRKKKNGVDDTTTMIIDEDTTTMTASASAATAAVTETTTTSSSNSIRSSMAALLGKRPPDKDLLAYTSSSSPRNKRASAAGGAGGIVDVDASDFVAAAAAAAAVVVDNEDADSTQGVAGDDNGGGSNSDGGLGHASEQSSSQSTEEQQKQQQQQQPENKDDEDEQQQQQQKGNTMLVVEDDNNKEEDDQKPKVVEDNGKDDNNDKSIDTVEEQERQWQLHKKRHLQQRREDDKSGRLLCRCDYNPFCLGTLGGVMNEVIQRGLKLAENSDANNNAASAAASASPAANNSSRSSSSSSSSNNGLVVTSPASSNSASSRENVDVDDDDEVVLIQTVAPTTTAAAAAAGDADDEHEIEIIQDDDNDDNEKEDFPSYCTPATLDRLRNIRRSKLIDTNRIRKHLQSTLKGLVSSPSTMDEYIERLRQEHDQLVFQNHLVSTTTCSPTAQTNNNDPDRFRLSIPPGISNLGATCYLNTQLQCLAQNTNFVQGIFSWRKQQVPLNPIDLTMTTGDNSNEPSQQQQQQQPEDRMTAVLSRFQRILIGMYAGPHAKINTREFSNSLGLDHYEQQDPNEFSRLLLERMHESFQTTTTNPASAREQEQQQHDLAELLPNLFQGCMRYETTCLHCHNKSTRDEEFMDINLPIIRPSAKADASPAASKNGGKKSSSSSTNGGQQQTILEAFAAAGNNDSDTNVQFCLDSYCGAERLEGDNQYYCGQCECKRDAKRQLKFQKLPPCLNVQLSRYIFDMQTLSKKKAMDKVLLPTELTLYTKQTTPTTSRKKRGKANVVDDDEKICERRYILCAVMKHQGKLATSGHYVAEAMDWRTGQWFEFNDEKVTLLDSGCPNSYDPSFIAHNDVTNNNKDTEILNGKKTAAANANKRKRGADVNSKTSEKSMASNGITAIGSQDAYSMYYVDEDFLAQSVHESLRQGRRQSNDGMMGLVDRMAEERSKVYASLQQACFDDFKHAERMEGRRNFILNDMFAGHPSAHTVDLENADPPPVWVESDFLRRFLSCRDGLEVELKTGNSIVSDVLQQELVLCGHQEPGLHPREARRGKLLPRPMYDALVARLKVERGELIGKTWSGDDMEDPIISLSKNLICAECCEEYQTELWEKLDILNNALTLYHQLDNKAAECDTSYEPGTTFEKEEEMYVYLVAKKFATAFRNRVSGIMKQVAPADLTCVPNLGFNSNIAVESMAEGLDAIGSSELYFKDITDPDFDVRINSTITCKHGRLTSKNKRSFRYCSWGEWNELKELFPKAIMHRIRKVATGGAVELSDSCPDCEAEGNAVDNLSVRLCGLAKFCKSSECKALDCEGVAKMTPGTTVRLVHSSELNAFQKFVSDFKRTNKKGNENIESQLKKVLTPQNTCFVSRVPKAKSTRTLSAGESKRLAFLSSWTRPLICKEHSLPIRAAVLDSPSGSTNVAGLRDRVAVLDEGSYRSFVSQLAAVAVVMEPSKEALADTDTDEEVNVFLAEASDLLDSLDIDECYPKSKLVVHRSSVSPESQFAFTSNTLATTMTVCGGICEDAACNEGFREWENQEELLGSSTVASARNGLGTAASDPIAVDSDIDDRKGSDTFILRVVEADGDADNEAILMALAQYSGTPTTDSTLRRSSRRKKARMPIGVLMNEQNVEADICHNAAALRLLLFESLNGSFELDHRLKLAVTAPIPPPKEPITLDVEDSLATGAATSQVEPPKLVSIDFFRNESSLFELCQDGLPDNKAKDKDFNPKEHLILVRQSTKDESAKECCPEDHLMDFLIALSNVLSKDTKQSDSSGDRKRKTRFQERGFTGTFLSSAPPLSKAAGTNGEKGSDGGTDKEDNIVTVRNESKVDGSEARKKTRLSAVVELTDDSKESSPASSSSTKSSSAGDGNGARDGGEPSAIHVENDNGNSDRVFQVVEVLLQNKGVNQSDAWDSADWAVATYPEMRDISELAGNAYAKYLDNSVL